MTSEEAAEIKQLRTENAGLWRANAIPKAAPVVQPAELDRPSQYPSSSGSAEARTGGLRVPLPPPMCPGRLGTTRTRAFSQRVPPGRGEAGPPRGTAPADADHARHTFPSPESSGQLLVPEGTSPCRPRPDTALGTGREPRLQSAPSWRQEPATSSERAASGPVTTTEAARPTARPHPAQLPRPARSVDPSRPHAPLTGAAQRWAPSRRQDCPARRRQGAYRAIPAMRQRS